MNLGQLVASLLFSAILVYFAPLYWRQSSNDIAEPQYEVSWIAPNGESYPLQDSPYVVGSDGKTNIERDPNYMDKFSKP